MILWMMIRLVRDNKNSHYLNCLLPENDCSIRLVVEFVVFVGGIQPDYRLAVDWMIEALFSSDVVDCWTDLGDDEIAADSVVVVSSITHSPN